MSTANRGILRGEALLAYIEAEAILQRIGPDPDGPAHLCELAKELGCVCSKDGCANSTRARGLCDNHYRKARRRITAAELAEEVEHLSQSGESAESIVSRIGPSAVAIARSLHRSQHHELARPFDGIVNAQRAASRRSA